MADRTTLGRSLALDVVREHLPDIERAATVEQARPRLAATIEQARQVLVQQAGPGDTTALDRAVDELLAAAVVMHRPRIDRLGRLYDAASDSERRWSWLAAGLLLLVAGLVAVGLLVARGG